MERSDILNFVSGMKTTDHVILLYSGSEEKNLVLFTYLQAGLDNGEAVAYVTGDETPDQIRKAMKDFGIDVEKLEKKALFIIDYNDWYIVDGTFDKKKVIDRWVKLYDDVVSQGFKGLRVTGEMACFFKHELTEELVEYEKSLHRKLEFPMTAICAYNTDVVASHGKGELYLELIRAHSTVIFTHEDSGLVKSIG